MFESRINSGIPKDWEGIMDRCKNCVLRGDIEACEKESCSVHCSWYAKTIKYNKQSHIYKKELMDQFIEFLRDRLKEPDDTKREGTAKICISKGE